MSILFRIALRNLSEHRGKTLIIGILVALGVIVLVVGNALMDTARAGIQRAFIDNYTGDIMISGTAEGPVSLFGVQSVGGIDPTPVLPDFDEIIAYAEANPHITDITTQITGFGLLRPQDDRIEGFEHSVLTILFGAEPRSYGEMFDNVEVIEGRYLQPGEEGLMLSTDRIEELEETALEALEELDDEQVPESYPIHVGDQVRVIGMNSDGLPRIRVLPLVGIYEITGISEGVGFELVSYIDPQTLRAIQRLNLGTDEEIELDSSQTELLDATDDSLFSQDDFFSGDIFGSEDEGGSGDVVDFGDIDAMLGEPSTDTDAANTNVVTDTDAEFDGSSTWHYILMRVDSPRRVESVVADFNAFFSENGIDAQAGDWEVAAGPFATTADVIRTVFNVAIIVIGVVAVIIMMNTLVISVMERTSEIGTMRALGAARAFVWRMFMYEILTITTVFGLIGTALALAIIGVLNLIGIPATNTFLTVLFAGPALHPVASVTSVVSSLIVVSVVGLLAHLYPVAVALKIQPIRAIQTE